MKGKWYLAVLLLAAVLLAACGAEPAAETTVPVTTVAPTTEPATEPTTVPTEPKDPVAERAGAILATMTLKEKVYQLFIVTQDQLTGIAGVTRSGDATRTALEEKPVGGIIYFASNLKNREQTVSMIENIQSYAKLGLFISVDEEGGPVTRLGQNPAMGITEFRAMGRIGAAEDPEQARNVGLTLGTELKELGFNLDFAPVADVDSNPKNPVIGNRAFHSDPAVAAELVAACVEGFGESGILCTLKHFPGHGDTATDSHHGEVRIDKSLAQLWQCELLPFASGIEAGAPVIMVGHITLPKVTKEAVPATLSHEIVTGLLRRALGYEGLIVTDSMSMGAVTDRYSSGEGAVKAVAAGVDLILMPKDLDAAVAGILEAIETGELTEERIDESVLRILETKLRAGIINE